MSSLEYTLDSIKKSIYWDIPNKFYNSNEVVHLLNSVLGVVDHVLFEEYDIKRKKL